MTQSTEFPRRFVAADAKLDQWNEIEPYFKQLAERDLADRTVLEQWLVDVSELESVLAEERSQAYTKMTCFTADEDAKQRYLHIIENIIPKCEPWEFELQKKFAAAADQLDLPPQRYEVLVRSAQNQVDLFREENIPLQTEDAKLAQRYQEVTGGLTVTFRGEEQTPQQVARFLEEPDRKTREEAWRALIDRYLQEAETLDPLYDEMVSVRDKIAKNADCADYREYAFKSKERFDYTPEDCLAFHAAIESVVVPAVKALADQRQKQLGVETLRPWDLEVDPQNRPPLKPFTTVEELNDGCSRIFHKVNRELGDQFDRMRTEGYLDLDSRKNKAPGGYQAVFEEQRLPFIFMNAVGTEGDVRTLLHEGGHAFHTFACRAEPFVAYRHSPMEFAEVASMGMECLAVPHLDEFYNGNTQRAVQRFFTKIVNFFPWMARVDAFQHYVYTNVDHDPERRKDEWQSLTRRFAPHIDYTGLERADRHSWHQKLHFFQVPFYYVEYGIAQLGALQVFLNSKRDYQQAVNFYRHALALGGSRPLPELFEAANLKFDFTEQTIRPLIEAAMEEIGDDEVNAWRR